jgi:hypothetical protein
MKKIYYSKSLIYPLFLRHFLPVRISGIAYPEHGIVTPHDLDRMGLFTTIQSTLTFITCLFHFLFFKRQLYLSLLGNARNSQYVLHHPGIVSLALARENQDFSRHAYFRKTQPPEDASLDDFTRSHNIRKMVVCDA